MIRGLGDHVVDAANRGAFDFGDQFLTGDAEIVERERGFRRTGDGDEGGVDLGDVFLFDDLAEIPAEGAVAAGEVAHAAEVVHFVHDHEEFVVHSAKRFGEDGEGFGGGAGAVGVEKDENDVGAFGEPADDGAEVVAAVGFGIGGVDHAGGVDEGDVF